MGAFASEILKKKHGYDQRQDMKDEAEKAEKNLEASKNKEKKQDEKPADMKAAKDKRDLGDSSADGKKSGEDAEKGKKL